MNKEKLLKRLYVNNHITLEEFIFLVTPENPLIIEPVDGSIMGEDAHTEEFRKNVCLVDISGNEPPLWVHYPSITDTTSEYPKETFFKNSQCL